MEKGYSLLAFLFKDHEEFKMKKLVIALGLVASLIALTGCASNCHTCSEKAATPAAHQDLKGEVVKK